ncbi:hypothetical protein POTOM_008147 [Populus tomentosa]|uniref:Uncharacterized protein n=1 Tax=Populus tomentosa TaxID=118781 RepID=A0A8X8ADI7_POPTO|nr:hypothetical protein POTOM_008147 [Populus tomentosa]
MGGDFVCYTLLYARNPHDSNRWFRIQVETWDDMAKLCFQHLKPNDHTYVSGHLESYFKVSNGNPKSSYKAAKALSNQGLKPAKTRRNQSRKPVETLPEESKSGRIRTSKSLKEEWVWGWRPTAGELRACIFLIPLAS